MWQPCRDAQQTLTERLAQHQRSTVTMGGKTMRYVAFRNGDPSSTSGYPLYIALHGGGGVPASVNDQCWESMMSPMSYRGSVWNGVFVAPRGISNTWDLHFQAETYVLLERLIENMVEFSSVDPDRVYLLGSSAGGDGVYQLAPRLADRLAAANMSAGHPNGVSLVNLSAMPICLQVGEHDISYDRHRVTAEYGGKLDALAEGRPGQAEYKHATFIHKACGHSIPDYDRRGTPYPVNASPIEWLAARSGSETSTVNVNTNAIFWVSQFKRQALPSRVIWDLKTRAERTSQGLWYWLDVGTETATSLGTDTIIVALDASRNAIIVEKARTILRILLNDEMLDLDRPLHVFVGGQHFETRVNRSEALRKATLAQRSDMRWVFSARIDIVQDDSGWTLLPQE